MTTGLKNNICFFIITFFFSALVYGQSIDYSNTEKLLQFGKHLVTSNQYEEAEVFFNSIDSSKFNFHELNEFYYLRGWNYYQVKELELSLRFFVKVDSESNYYLKSRFFAAYNNVYTHNYNSAITIFNSLNKLSPELEELKAFQLSGIALLNRDYESFKTQEQKFSLKYYPIVKEEKKFQEYYSNLGSYKSKSKALAALLSTIIPGSGKVYAGRLGEGISAFFIVTSLGLMSFENYNKAGITNPKTILFGSMFTTFYVGNIWGSYISVHMQNEEFNHEMDHKILFNLHIPLRTIFN